MIERHIRDLKPGDIYGVIYGRLEDSNVCDHELWLIISITKDIDHRDRFYVIELSVPFGIIETSGGAYDKNDVRSNTYDGSAEVTLISSVD